MEYVFVGLVALAGSFVQSAGGFGYAIICMALWPLVMPFKSAAIIEMLTAFAMVLYITSKLRKSINFRLFIWPTASSLIVSTFGVLTLMASTESLIRRILGIALVLLGIYFIFWGDKVRVKPTLLTGAIAGAVSGFCGGLFGIGGPPIAVYFLSAAKDKLEYNATLQCYFLFTAIYIFGLHLMLGNVTFEILDLSATGFLGLGIGTIAGSKLFTRLSMRQIRKFVYILMWIVGIYFVITG